MSGWLSNLLKSGPVLKHWWREHDHGTYKIVASAEGQPGVMVAVIAFAEDMPIQAQHCALARIVKGLDS